MIYYINLWLAFLLAQNFVSTMAVWVYQRNNPNIDYFPALKLYYKKEVGKYIMITSFTLLVTFIISDWMDLSLTKIDLMSKAELSRFEAAQMRFKTYAAGYGMFVELLAPLVFKGGRNAIKNFGKEKGIDLDN